MSIKKERFGTLQDGSPVYCYIMQNGSGASVKITEYGGAVVELHMPGRDGKTADVVCGYDDLEGYLKGAGYQGALIGRFGNRIAEGRFTLNGKEYVLAKNERGVTHLHGGNVGFDQKIWKAEAKEDGGDCVLNLSIVSPDGEEGYPGRLDVQVTYTLTAGNALKISYTAVCDQDTVLNLTNHAFFNLGGYDGGDVLGHELTIDAGAITEVDELCIPTGRLLPVEGTPFDFRRPKAIGKEIGADHPQLRYGNGYDHNFVLNNNGKTAKVVEVYEPKSGRVMEVFTDQPGIQLYTANSMDGGYPFKNGVKQQVRHALCLETQFFPDGPHHQNFPSCVLRAGETYRHNTTYQFSVR